MKRWSPLRRDSYTADRKVASAVMSRSATRFDRVSPSKSKSLNMLALSMRNIISMAAPILFVSAVSTQCVHAELAQNISVDIRSLSLGTR